MGTICRMTVSKRASFEHILTTAVLRYTAAGPSYPRVLWCETLTSC